MNAKVQHHGKIDYLYWLIIAMIAIAALAANYYFASVQLPIRLMVWVVVACGELLLAVQTTQGKEAWSFIKEARIELQKVVWPTRQETVQTTMVVVAMVIVTALLLWGIDSVLLWIVALLTGQRG